MTYPCGHRTEGGLAGRCSVCFAKRTQWCSHRTDGTFIGYCPICQLRYPVGGIMPDYIETEGKEDVGSNTIWAIASIIIVAILAGVIYFGFKQLGRDSKHEIDVKIETPRR